MKSIWYVVFILLFNSSFLIAQEKIEPVFYNIKINEVAPFEGILLNAEALGIILASADLIKVEDYLSNKLKSQKEIAELHLDIKNVVVEKEFLEKKIVALENSYQKELDFLMKNYEQNKPLISPLTSGIIGFGSGVVVVLLSVYLYTQI
ncbi:hypothetical protein M0R19_04305 [Candidatus Pacearchaeota archaeon]|nr:hypothetical protein [Candidatus Pacearchaeota archaeon]